MLTSNSAQLCAIFVLNVDFSLSLVWWSLNLYMQLVCVLSTMLTSLSSRPFYCTLRKKNSLVNGKFHFYARTRSLTSVKRHCRPTAHTMSFQVYYDYFSVHANTWATISGGQYSKYVTAVLQMTCIVKHLVVCYNFPSDQGTLEAVYSFVYSLRNCSS